MIRLGSAGYLLLIALIWLAVAIGLALALTKPEPVEPTRVSVAVARLNAALKDAGRGLSDLADYLEDEHATPPERVALASAEAD
ncbi:MAG TPA: hypothetical protein VF212_17580 [Longimicrobiales bacterium]